SEAAEALAGGADAVRKHFANVDPDDGTLRKGKEGDVCHEQPDQQRLVGVRQENVRDARETKSSANGTDEQQFLSANFVDQRHGKYGEDEVGGANDDSLQVCRDFAEAGLRKNLVEVVQNGVDTGELVEHGDGDGEKDRKGIPAAEEGFAGVMFSVD